MGVQYSFGKVINSSLILSVDAADRNSFPVTGSLNSLDLTGTSTYTGSLTNGASYNSIFGGTFTFAGDNDFIQFVPQAVGQNPAYIFSGSVTSASLEAWCYPTSINRNQNIINIDGNSGFRFRLDNLNRFWALAGNAGSFTTINETNTRLANQWYHVVASVANNAFFLYVNGSQVASNTSMTFNPSNATAFQVGIGGPASNEYWAGYIPIARIYRKNLSAQEVLNNYNVQKSRFGL